MKLFGRKANQSPTSATVPPELKPYYDGPSLGSRLRRAVLLVLPIIAAAALIAALIFGGVWLKHRRDSEQASKSSQSAQQATQGAPSESGSSSTQGQNQSTGNQTNDNPSSSSEQSDNTQSQAAQPSTTPNTGPGSDIVILAVTTGAAATLLAYMWQLKTLRSR